MSLDASAALPATVHFCEARLPGPVAEPANTWSSLGYILVGVWLFARRGAASRAPLATVAIAEIGIGVGSIALHGTGTFAGEVLDLTGMFFLSACLFALGVGRLLRLSDRAIAGLWGLAVAVPLALLAVVHGSGIGSFAVLLAAGIVAELVLYRRDHTVGFRRFVQALGIFGVAFAFWILDMTRVACLPDNHVFTGHAVWHLLNAWSIERLYAFYRESLGVPGTALRPEPTG